MEPEHSNKSLSISKLLKHTNKIICDDVIACVYGPPTYELFNQDVDDIEDDVDIEIEIDSVEVSGSPSESIYDDIIDITDFIDIASDDSEKSN